MDVVYGTVIYIIMAPKMVIRYIDGGELAFAHISSHCIALLWMAALQSHLKSISQFTISVKCLFTDDEYISFFFFQFTVPHMRVVFNIFCFVFISLNFIYSFIAFEIIFFYNFIITICRYLLFTQIKTT